VQVCGARPVRVYVSREESALSIARSMDRQPLDSSIFTNEFLALDPEEIASVVRTDGVFSMHGALTREFVAAIESDIADSGFGLNVNDVHGVYFGRQYYVSHMLAVSPSFYGFCTHPKVLDVCGHVLGKTFRLKAQRYYETYGGHVMRWHTDNKTDSGFSQIPGLIFIAYVSDVEDGEFQYVRGSQAWSGAKAYNEYDGDWIEREHGERILGFKGARGTVVIYDTYGIHRAKPVARSGFARKSLFFQVDGNVDDGEPILLKTEFVDRIDERLKQYLGFGKPSEYSSFPVTRLQHLPLSRKNLALLSKWVISRTLRAGYDALPIAAKNRLRKWLGRAA
jgi:hypothetical protein